jgi:hypothetical protein
MKKPKQKVMCHGCLDDFDHDLMFRVLIDARSPHYIYECKSCRDSDCRAISSESLTCAPTFKT